MTSPYFSASWTSENRLFKGEGRSSESSSPCVVNEASEGGPCSSRARTYTSFIWGFISIYPDFASTATLLTVDGSSSISCLAALSKFFAALNKPYASSFFLNLSAFFSTVSRSPWIVSRLLSHFCSSSCSFVAILVMTLTLLGKNSDKMSEPAFSFNPPKNWSV